ncbi:MAG: efflux transporter protein [Hyphomicrobiales bacterium]|nr:efflux transporter protein [Hyphomicrobiales bacterium]
MSTQEPNVRLSRRALMAGAFCAAATGQGARAAGEFAGKTITIIVGFPPGGGVDTGARLMAKHLPRFLDGAPGIVIQNMPGAGGVTAADHLFTRAARDGLTLGVPGRDWPLVPVLDQRGGRYEPLEFEYIGSTGQVNTFVWLSKALGLETPEAFRASARQVVFGGLTPDTQPSMVPKILGLNGFPVKAVSGYRGTADIVNAIEKGEVDAIATNAASFARRPDMIEKTVRIFQLLPSREPVPLAADFVAPESRNLLQLTGYASATGMPLVAPPKAPPERVAALAAAFAKMARDPEFASDAEKLGEPHGEPIEGARIRQILAETIKAATPDVLATFRKLSSQSN